MKRAKRILVGMGCILLLTLSWITAVAAKTDRQKQEELLACAKTYLADDIYILAVEPLEEAASFDDDYTQEAEETLKRVYLQLADQSDYNRRYTALLDKQMTRKDAGAEVFLEAAQYYLVNGKEDEAFSVLRTGIAKTQSEKLFRLYEDTRYAYTMGRSAYQEVTAIFGGGIQVRMESGWGVANGSGTLVIPCEYDQVSTCGADRVIVSKNGTISAVDFDNNRVALLHERAEGFGNYADDRLGLQTEDGWILSTGEFAIGSLVFEELGMYSDGYAPAKLNGKWGVIDTSGSEWLLPPKYDRIVQDELGRCYAQGAVFAEQNGQVYLLVDGQSIGGPYEDARPFADRWAAVKQGGKWGFIDREGTVQISCQYDEALSFGQHLAAVKVGENWGYISLSGELVIPAQFQGAKSFSNGSAPVLDRERWRFITLLEYREGAHL